jgi:hypothetical protein
MTLETYAPSPTIVSVALHFVGARVARSQLVRKGGKLRAPGRGW